MPRETAQEIDRAAADWVARVDRDLTPQEAERLDVWLAGDDRRAGAYGRLRALALQTERARALAPGFSGSTTGAPRRTGLPRRHLLTGAGGALAAGLAGVGLFGLAARRGTVRTRLGEVRVVPLADGSVMTLNTDTLVRVSYSGERRLIDLVEGEALFDVAPDPARPFIVDAGATQARAVGTSFTVRRLGDEPVEVLVREGVVEVERRGKARPPVRISADVRATSPVDQTSPVMTTIVGAGAVGRELAWREGRIAFEGETLGQAAAKFARYSETRIVIDDPRIAAEEITGLFQANDPVGFTRAVASSFGLKAEVGEGEVRLIR
ncbi:FecR domain-containing protein [Brevundimonas staleyi]|uniref:FecR family protein n=1 Tax=Brevundimonas staleyi TaxID=74326 RepID=A0ABW0FWS7_9CAUL